MTENYHAGSRLEKTLRSGKMAVTVELSAPDSVDPESVYQPAALLPDYADGVNATDASGANCHMSSVAMCSLLEQKGYEPVFQVSCRDRNRIAMQGDMLGAAALGIKNVLCVTGDDVSSGDQPESKAVFDFDSVQLLRVFRSMRDQGIYLSGRKIEARPKVFLGAACNPFAKPYDWRPQRLAKKQEAGADFVQTQYCFDVPLLKRFMQQVCDMGLNEKVFILIGVGPLRSARVAEFMRTKVPGIHIPDEVVERMRKAPKEDRIKVGKEICVEIIQQVKEIKGVSGFHIMAYRQEEIAGEIIEEAGVWPRLPIPH
ncbi:MAG: methylenetetrahydrofolate reductase [Chloroflexi bacterium]|nr:MAG: methylenetetrahydrofolate reductase [Chloroflexota bacterium]MBL1193801.1 methylenetetrahydrofolate reductase [Chloroflexota bacterium]NOH11094.1 methylenetetrahydrofolate reductase [Chloroflexota bacterium]